MTMRLKRSVATWIALASMMAQVVFGFAHAMAAVGGLDRERAAGGGYLEICTVHGLVRLPAPDLPDPPSPGEDGQQPITKCPACLVLKQVVVSPPSASIRVERFANEVRWEIGIDDPDLDGGPPSPLRSRAPPPQT